MLCVLQARLLLGYFHLKASQPIPCESHYLLHLQPGVATCRGSALAQLVCRLSSV